VVFAMGKISTRMNKLEQRMSKLEKDQQNITKTQIIQLLSESNSPFSNKPRYTYDEISTITGRSTGYVSNLAQKQGLSRRNNLKSI
jgi:hypothetical protein